MSETAREVIADFFTAHDFPKTFSADHAAGMTIEALTADGFVIVPREALAVVMEVAECATDEGPSDEGWKSAELSNAIETVNAALGAKASEQ